MWLLIHTPARTTDSEHKRFLLVTGGTDLATNILQALRRDCLTGGASLDSHVVQTRDCTLTSGEALFLRHGLFTLASTHDPTVLSIQNNLHCYMERGRGARCVMRLRVVCGT